MAYKPQAMDVTITAAEYVLSDQPPLYKDLDCYRFVRQCVRDNGGDMRYSGSNDVYRNGCSELVPLKQAMDYDLLKAGWVLFIVEPESASTPAKYRGDGKQDATHMGLYTGLTVTRPDGTEHYIEVAHSSFTRGMVAASTLKNAWNWAGKLKGVDYSAAGWEPGLPEFDEDGEPVTDTPETAPSKPAGITLPPHSAIVVSDTLRARKTLSTKSSSNVVMEMKKGRVLTDIQTGYWFDSGEPAISGMIAGTRHPRVYAAVRDLTNGEQYLRVNDSDVEEVVE